MIVDSFDYIACYKGLHPNLDTAIDWLNSHTLDALENGKTIIDGDKVFVNVMDADLREAEGAAFEYHRRYADLQINLTGSEHWGWASEGKDGRVRRSRRLRLQVRRRARRRRFGRRAVCHLLPRRAA